jgi:hypothetical protein
MLFPFRVQAQGLAEAARRKDGGWMELRRFAHNLRREPIFVYFFRRNPLKSPDSEKQMEGNESYLPVFICIYLHLFARNSRRG